MTGQADVRWIWMAVALVVVAVPVLTLLISREIRAQQQRILELEERLEAVDGGRVRAELDRRTAELDRRTAELDERATRATAALDERTTRAAAQLDDRTTRATTQLDERTSRAAGQLDERATRAAGQFDERTTRAAAELDRYVAELTARATRASAALEERAAGVTALTGRAAAALEQHAASLEARIATDLAAQQREQRLSVLRALSAMRPPEPEFTEEYFVEAPKVGPPTAGVPTVEGRKVEPLMVEAPTAEGPTAEASTVEASAVEASAVEESEIEASEIAGDGEASAVESGAADDVAVRYAVTVDLVWIPEPRLPDRHGRLLLRRTVHPRWPGVEGAPVTEFWISAPTPEDALLVAPPPVRGDTWDRIVLGQPTKAVASPVPLQPPTDGDRRDLRALLGRPVPADQAPERTTRPLLDLDATVRVTTVGGPGERAYVERARVGHAASDVLTIALRSAVDRPLAALTRIGGHPGTPAPAGGHERSARRSHWYREAELTRTVFADLELRDAVGESDHVTVARFAASEPVDLAVIPERRPESWRPDPLEVRATGAFGRFLRGLMVIASAGETHLMTRAPSAAALLEDGEIARALAAMLAPAGTDPDVVTLQGMVRAIVDSLPTDWKDGRDLDLDSVGPVSVVRVDGP